jgi:hypothetical protein
LQFMNRKRRSVSFANKCRKIIARARSWAIASPFPDSPYLKAAVTDGLFCDNAVL